ncbi:prepilin-type N-terminal cleavage/methylation domain-containing protein [Campylobacter sp. 9BO]|uniref:prepilin-type N-terminal cleavage/methylation domain-containing protein n=1 Tax=Campylobacter sp. 9BO TaxID=3424759 RepID=UPI003D34E36B
MKKGFSLIETIVSIVIIGIISLALPAIMKLSANANAKSTLSQSVTNAKSALVLAIKSPYTCAYINKYKGQSVPIFASENFYIKFGIFGEGRRNFADTKILASHDGSCSGLQSIDKIKSENFTPNNTSDFTQNFSYEISTHPTRAPFDESISTLENFDTKLVTINGKAGTGDQSQNIRMHAIVTNIGELEGVMIKQLK